MSELAIWQESTQWMAAVQSSGHSDRARETATRMTVSEPFQPGSASCLVVLLPDGFRHVCCPSGLQ